MCPAQAYLQFTQDVMAWNNRVCNTNSMGFKCKKNTYIHTVHLNKSVLHALNFNSKLNTGNK